MNAIDIITLIAIILFARLGIRLFLKYRKLKKEDQNNQTDNDESI